MGTAGQQYCLKWNNHQNNLLRVFSRLLGQEQFTDVVVAAEGRHVKCHKVSNVNGGLNLIFFSFQMILSACSSYFEQLFINFNEPHQVVILKDTSFADIVAIVEFMYKGEINVSQVGKRGGGLEPSGSLGFALQIANSAILQRCQLIWVRGASKSIVWL